jgi:hypothetical protein
MVDEKTYTERIKVAGDAALGKVRELIHEGNVRRLIIRNEDERILIEIPLTVGAVGVLLAPVAAAVGAVAALVTHCTIEVEKVGEAPDTVAPPPGTTYGSEMPPSSSSGATPGV